MDRDLWVLRGDLEENSEEISSVALLSPACFPWRSYPPHLLQFNASYLGRVLLLEVRPPGLGTFIRFWVGLALFYRPANCPSSTCCRLPSSQASNNSHKRQDSEAATNPWGLWVDKRKLVGLWALGAKISWVGGNFQLCKVQILCKV
jgi:hypothetical protein